MKSVVIGMSGGVDSSVAAIILKKQGYNVIGLFMRNWDSTINNDYLGNPNLNNNICPQEQDYNDALEVCNKIGIPLHRVDFVKEYWDFVFTYFLDELKKGRTPNPDVMCNKYIKFDLFVKKAKELGADYIATGHYAKLIDGKLAKAKDKNKDQSYFLAYVNRDIFKNVLFPLGDIEKPEVRKIAEEYDLITAKKKDLDKNILYIAIGDENKYLFSNTAVIEDFNFLTDERPSKCTCKFRYRQSDIDINVKYLDNNNLLLSYKGSKAVTPGQFCVLYDKDICLGGGIIKEVK